VPAVEVTNLRKEFRRRDRRAGRFARRRRMPALNDVTFTIARGECVEACAAVEIAVLSGAASADRYAAVVSIANVLYAMLTRLIR